MCILSLPTDHYFFGSTFRSSVCVTGEEVNRKVMDVFTELSRELRQLRDIPLSINSLQEPVLSSGTLRYVCTIDWKSSTLNVIFGYDSG